MAATNGFVFAKLKTEGACCLGNLGLFVRLARTVNSGVCWVFLKVCMKATRRIIPEILCNILITLHIHSPCHISLTVQQFWSQTNCSCTKLHVTAVSYRDSRADTIHRFSPTREIQQKVTAGPTAITNCTSKGFQTTLVQL